ncbi:HIT family protein [Corynebacterium kroppenstedtii]|uniref:HIT family protein n=1 Tax=Corynebacterium sp. PCR 32 TaxID=3351342 RepID=UPI0030AF6927
MSTDNDTFVDAGAGKPDRLTRLWAPYRMSYIADEHRDSSDPFEKIPQGSDEEGLIVARGDTVYCLLNLFPYNSGHMLVVPYRRVANVEDLTDAESAELMVFVKKAIRSLKAVSHPHAVNVGMNVGKASGGSIADHLHVHIVPRWTGDANFMTVIGGTKVLPQLLRDTRELLAEAWLSLEVPHEHHDERTDMGAAGSADQSSTGQPAAES